MRNEGGGVEKNTGREVWRGKGRGERQGREEGEGRGRLEFLPSNYLEYSVCRKNVKRSGNW
jgi:hypothetical protein